MSEYIVYWKYYWVDEDDQPGHFQWYCRNSHLFRNVRAGDTLWVAVSGGPQHPAEWRVLERMVVERSEGVADSGYGPYRFVGDASKSERFAPEDQPDFSTVLRSLEFASGKRIQLEGALIGRALQTARRLGPADSWQIRCFVAGVVDPANQSPLPTGG